MIRSKIFALFLAAISAVWSTWSIAASQEPGDLFAQRLSKDGIRVETISPEQPIQATPGKVEVVELFQYQCPHCYRLEPHIERWLATKPADIQFRRIHGTRMPEFQPYARLFYALQRLGRDDLHEEIFRAVFEGAAALRWTSEWTDETHALAAITPFMKQHGIDPVAFTQTYSSDQVIADVQRAKDSIDAYGVAHTPALIVDGKYRIILTRPECDACYEHMVAITNRLVEHEKDCHLCGA
jgi:thiol:disulfide interchange protein DsbA